MMWDLLVWLTVLFMFVLLFFLTLYQLMCFEDLECDYVKPFDSASRINRVVLPEYALQGILCLLFLLSQHWFMFLLCAPNLFYNVRLYMQRQHLFDVTEIYNQIKWAKKPCFIKFMWYLLMLLLTLFLMVASVVEKEQVHQNIAVLS